MKVLYISYDGMTDPLGQSQVLPYLKGLAGAGYQIHLLSFEKPRAFEREEILVKNICDEAGIQWHPLPYHAKPPVLSSIADYFSMLRKAEQLQEEIRFDLVHCRSYLPGMTGMHLQKKYGVKFLFDIRGFWADERVEGNLWNRKNPLFNTIYLFFKKKEKQMFDAADGIISLTSKAIPFIREIQKQENRNKPLLVIPCCADTDHFDPGKVTETASESLKRELKIEKNAFVLCYLGGIGTWYKAEEMFDFYQRLLKRFPQSYFLLVTREPGSALLNIAAKKNIPADRIIVKAAARKEIPLYLSLADASIYFIMHSYSKQASSPTKQAEVMCMGLPLICNPGVGDSADILQNNNTGYICREYNVQAYDKIIAALEHPVSPSEKMRIRQIAIDNFSLTDGIDRYKEMYHLLLHE